MDEKKRPGKYACWLKLFFPPAETMAYSYPFLIARPFLLPACWVLRGAKCVLFKRRHMLHMISDIHSISKKDIAGIESLHKKAGL
jgi:hypothetical protein